MCIAMASTPVLIRASWLQRRKLLGELWMDNLTISVPTPRNLIVVVNC